MKKYLLLMILLPFIASCDNTWSSENKDLFVQVCLNDARKRDMPEDKAKKMCDCRLETIMKKHPKFAEAMENITEVVSDPDLKNCEPTE